MSISRTLLKPIAKLAGWNASRDVGRFLAAHRRTEQVQAELLRQLVETHSNTAFGRDHGFAAIRNYADFKAAVAVNDYETLRPYMNRVFNGEYTAMLPPGEPPVMFSMTSGTTGEPKYIPVTRRFLAHMRRGWNMFGISVLKDHPAAWLRPILQISSPVCEKLSPTSLPCGAISGMLAQTQKKIVRKMYVAPRDVYSFTDPDAKYYTLLRCGICHDVAIITTANPSSTLKLMETGQRHIERLLRDVADGTLTPPGRVDEKLMPKRRFRKNPALAKRLEDGIKRDGRLLPRHFWNVVFMTNWTGGTLKLYIRKLKELFGDVPIRDIGLLASEGRFSLPLADGTAAGVAEITANFLEFIPADCREQADPPTLAAHELETGGEYFLVITNWAGLWRYNIDDRIRVVGHHGHSPVFEFLSRGMHTANITGEKITEHQVVEAMRQASAGAGMAVERFIMQGRFADTPFYELRMECTDGQDCKKLCELMDKALGELNVEYESKRKSGRLGPMQIVCLPTGTLERMEQDNISRRRGRSEQYKHQFLLTDVLEADAVS